jgi:hypothetical protein
MLTAIQSVVNVAGRFRSHDQGPDVDLLNVASGYHIGVRMGGIDGAAINWAAVYVMSFPVSTLYTCWSCEGTRAP